MCSSRWVVRERCAIRKKARASGGMRGRGRWMVLWCCWSWLCDEGNSLEALTGCWQCVCGISTRPPNLGYHVPRAPLPPHEQDQWSPWNGTTNAVTNVACLSPSAPQLRQNPDGTGLQHLVLSRIPFQNCSGGSGASRRLVVVHRAFIISFVLVIFILKSPIIFWPSYWKGNLARVTPPKLWGIALTTPFRWQFIPIYLEGHLV